MTDTSSLRACPNIPPCPHGGMFHDIYEPGDPYPTCCMGECGCGKPGTAMLQRWEDGTIYVLAADPVIRVTRELLDQAEPWAYDGEREILQLDTAGQWRYRYLRPDPSQERVLIFGRIHGHR
jgi:hypothetical protein